MPLHVSTNRPYYVVITSETRVLSTGGETEQQRQTICKSVFRSLTYLNAENMAAVPVNYVDRDFLI